MKTTIFIRILLATLLPLVLVFVLVITTINNIIYTNASTSGREATAREATQISRQLSDELDTISGYLQVVSQSMADLDYKAPDAALKAETLLRRLLAVAPSFLNAKFVFEPGIFPGKEYVYQTLIRKNGVISNIPDMTPASLRDPKQSSWYHTTLTTKGLFIDLAKDYAHCQDEELCVGPSLVFPILSGNRAVGVVGIDCNYKDMFDGSLLRQGTPWQTMLLTGTGQIVYSNNKEHIGRNLLEYPFAEKENLKNTLQTGSAFLQEAYAPPADAESFIALYPIELKDKSQSLYLYISIPSQDMYASAYSSMELIVSTSVLGILLLGFSVFVATRSIVRSVKELTVNFNKIANGDLDIAQNSPDSGQDEQNGIVEIDILQAALRKMLAQINLAHELRLKATEEQMEKEKILLASQAKSQFFANMSHEIRTPMNAILGIAEILLHNEHLTEQDRKYIQDIKISSDSLLTIINDILDISKLESGKLSLMDTNFNFHLLLYNIRTMVEYLAQPNNLQFVYEADTDLPLCLKGDDIRLRQVLLNILSNACKFTTCGSVSMRVTHTETSIQFVIADTGPGIKEDDLVFLFEPFKRVDSANASRVQGTGLGLSICKSLVEMMGGAITVQSVFGKGSSFVIIIPKILGDETALEVPLERIHTSYTDNVRVLVVDDNEINLSVAEGLLVDMYGLNCDLALSGPEAIEKVATNEYNLIFMDHMMPEMDGLETTKRIRAMGGKYMKVPIIAFTANAVKGARETMLAAGVDDYLTKPININELDAMLNKWITAEFKINDLPVA